MEIYIGKDYKTINDFMKALPSMSGEITVFLPNNEYVIDESMVFTSENTANKKIKFIGNGNTIISGGIKITDWEKKENSQLWFAKAPISEFRRLYVNGKTAQRARADKQIEGIGEIKNEYGEREGIIVSADKFGNYANIDDVELVWEQAQWRCFIHGVERVEIGEDGNKYVYMKQPYYRCGTNISGDSIIDPHGRLIFTPVYYNPFRIENAKELLTKPGQWYLDRKKGIVYYMPKADENMQNAEIIAPNVEQLVKINGVGIDNKVKNVEFVGIEFCNAAWNRPTHKGFATVQAQMLNASPEAQATSVKEFVCGAVELDFAENIVFDNCKFHNLGADAVRFVNGVCNTEIKNCEFGHISGGAIQIGLPEHQENPEKNCNVCKNNRIEQNIIEHIGEEFPCVPAILLYYPNGTVIRKNDIGYVPYSGISMGWGWTKEIKNVVNGNNVIEENAIHHFMCIEKDGGGIYTLGRQYNNVIRYNYFYNEVNYHSAIYTDNGSENVDIYGNVFENVTKYAFSWEPSIQNIRVHENYTDTMCSIMWARNSYTKNNFHFKKGHMCAEAKKIAMNAGMCSRKIAGNGEAYKFDAFPLMEDENNLDWYKYEGRYANGILYYFDKEKEITGLNLVLGTDVQPRSMRIYVTDEELEYKEILFVEYIGDSYGISFDEPITADKLMFVFEADVWKRGYMPIESIEII